jgi:hypothetical protein
MLALSIQVMMVSEEIGSAWASAHLPRAYRTNSKVSQKQLNRDT